MTHRLAALPLRAPLAAFAFLLLLAPFARCSPTTQISWRWGIDAPQRSGPFMPLLVDIEHHGPATAAVVRWETKARSITRPVNLAPGARQRVMLLVDDSVDPVLEVRTAEGEVLARSSKPPPPSSHSGSYPGRLVIVARPAQHRGFSGLRDMKMRIGGTSLLPAVVFIAALEIPEHWMGLESISAVVLGDDDFDRLPPRQLETLLHWTALGGSLIVCGGPSAARLTATVLASELPVVLTGRTTTLARLEGLAAVIPAVLSESGAAPLPVPVASARAGASMVIVEKGESGPTVVLARREYGRGDILYTGFDLSALPLARGGTRLEAQLWRLLVPRLAARREGWRYRQDAVRDTQDSIYDVTQITGALSVGIGGGYTSWIVATFVMSYWVLIGPVQWMVLKRRRQLHLVWVLTPALALVFCVLAFGLGWARRGGESSSRSLTVVTGETDATWAVADAFTRVFAFKEKRYQLTSTAGPFFTEIVGPENGEQASLTLSEGGLWPDDSRVNMWSDRTFRTRSFVKPGFDFPAELTVEYAAGKSTRIRGSITNGSPATLRSALLVSAHAVEPLGDVAPGQTVKLLEGREFRSAKSSITSRGRPDLTRLERERDWFSALTRTKPDDLLLVAVADGVLDDTVRLEPGVDRSERRTLLVWRLRPRNRGDLLIAIRPGHARFSLPSGPGSARATDVMVEEVKLAGRVTLFARLHSSPRPGFVPRTLTVHCEESNAPIQVRLKNWKRGTYDSIPTPSEYDRQEDERYQTDYSSYVTQVVNPTDYVQPPYGTVEIQIEATATAQPGRNLPGMDVSAVGVDSTPEASK